MDWESKDIRFLDGKLIPLLLSGVGGLFALLYVAELLVFYKGFDISSKSFLVGLFVSAVFTLALVYGGYWLTRSDLAPERYPRISIWVLSGSLLFFGINLPMIVIWSGDFSGKVSWSRWAASVGAAGGLLVGVIEARAIQRELAAQRAAIRAEEAESQRQWFDYLNGLLRHEVLNTTNVITGYTALLLEDEDLDETTASSLERIHRQGEDMAKVIRDVQVLIEVTQDTAELRPIELDVVLTDELKQIDAKHESVTAEISIPDRPVVLADDLLPRVFGNLFQNAVEHNDSERPEIRVTAERNEETISVHVADNGPGVPPDEQRTLFERSDNSGASHGLGLYLVRTLAERYGGSVELAETSADGSVFTVELPTAEATHEVGRVEDRPDRRGRTEDGHTDDRADARQADGSAK